MTQIEDVADTALWIAAYRAQETSRQGALFQDPLAARLAGPKGAAIASKMVGAEQFYWMTAVRTVVVDTLVQEALERGATTILNLGAGLDTRPYRLALPKSLRWVEADMPKIIDHKNRLLGGEMPKCALERVSVDLSDAAARRALLSDVAAESDHAVVLTEGLVSYLSAADVGALAEDVKDYPQFRAWIVDYSARFLTRAVRLRTAAGRVLKNAKLKFQPDDWKTFFLSHGWNLVERRDLPIEGERLGRPVPWPWWFAPVHRVLPHGAKQAIRQMFGYARLEPL
jgi:methyltransferase (TIGR00027 family)